VVTPGAELAGSTAAVRTPRYRAYAYPWDLLSEDPATTVGELADAGIDTVSATPLYHRVHCVMPRNRTRKTFIADASYAYFSPDPNRYRDLALKPEVHPDASERGYGAVVDAARRQGLGVSAWVIALHYSPHLARYRGLATQNLWGEPNPESVCPSNPDVQGYLAALSSDLLDQFGVDEIELETPHWDVFFNSVHGIHERIGVAFDPLDVLALSLCFCAACTAGAQQAGVDVDALRAALAVKVEATLQAGRGTFSSASIDEQTEWTSAIPGLSSFLDFRRGVTTQLITTVARAVTCPVSVMYDPWDGYGLDGPALGSLGVRLTGLVYSADTAVVRDRAIELLRQHPGPTDWRVVLSLFARDLSDPGVLRRHVAALGELGLTDIGFYNSSLASGEAMAALRQALADAADGQRRRDHTAEMWRGRE
jgi:hypothetical protein